MCSKKEELRLGGEHFVLRREAVARLGQGQWLGDRVNREPGRRERCRHRVQRPAPIAHFHDLAALFPPIVELEGSEIVAAAGEDMIPERMMRRDYELAAGREHA